MKRQLKHLYTKIPFKPQLFSFVRKIFKPEEKIYKHLHFKGRFKVKVEKNITFFMQHYGYQLENDIFWKGLTGRWEKKSIELWMALSKKAMIVMDIGANTGIYSLVSKSLNHDATVIAFEPIERVNKKLVQNIQLNNFCIKTYSEAISDAVGETVFYDTIDEHPYTAKINKVPFDDSYYHPIKVKIITIDKFVKERQIGRLDLIKIDVEYHEPEVIKGFSLISKFRPSILIEILSDDIGIRVQQELEKHVSDYLYFDIDEENGFFKVGNIRKSSGMNYLLCTEQIAAELNLI